MRVCFLLGGFTGIGGIGRVVSILANKLCQDPRNKIYTMSFINSGKANHYQIDERIVQTFLFNSPTNMRIAILKGASKKLRKFVQENDIDILIGCGALYYPLTILSTIGLNTKTICWEHSNAENNKDHAYQMLSRKIGAKYADFIVTLTKHDEKMYKKRFKTVNIKQIYNPIDENIFNYQKEYDVNSRKIVSVGRLSYQKNFELLVDVANKVLKENSNWSWDIYGDGELKKTIQDKINEYNIEDRIKLKGSVDNLYELYPNYAFLVMTSRYEGFPMTLLEGMANGLPLVSFDVLTGPKEIISDDVNGYLIEPFNFELIVNRIETLINDKNNRISMSVQSKQLSENFRINTIVQQWTALFILLLNTGDLE